ncbi:MAG: cyclase family protein [Nitrospinota bacterium]|nr:MAG: cyclase family protein [Nitrospinota bacterium]
MHIPVIDLSHRIDESLPFYPGDPRPEIREFARIDRDGFCVHQLHLGTHTGTHIDAPSHFIPAGRTIEQLELDRFIGPAVVIDCTDKGTREAITLEDITRHSGSIGAGDIVLFYTGWDRKLHSPRYADHPYLLPEGAEWLVEQGVKVVGIDALNIDPTWTNHFPVHDILLGKEVLIVENLTNLDRIKDSRPLVMLLPLPLAGCDGSPIRAVALPEGWTGQ